MIDLKILSNRQMVTRSVEDFGRYEVEDLPVQEVIRNLEKALERIPEDSRKSAVLTIDYDSECLFVYINYKTLETDAELQARLKREERWIEDRRRQYEELKKEFGE